MVSAAGTVLFVFSQFYSFSSSCFSQEAVILLWGWNAGANVKSRGIAIEKKIEFLENLAGKVMSKLHHCFEYMYLGDVLFYFGL